MSEIQLKFKIWLTKIPPTRWLLNEAIDHCCKNRNDAVILTDNYEKNKSRIKELVKRPGYYIIA